MVGMGGGLNFSSIPERGAYKKGVKIEEIWYISFLLVQFMKKKSSKMHISLVAFLY